MRRLMVVAGLMALLVVPVAWADKPDRSPAPPFEPATAPAGVVCPFAVTVQDVVNNGTVTTHYDKLGDIRWEHTSGTLIWRFTNAETSDSVDLNISGPGKTTYGDGFVYIDGSGPWALTFFPGDDAGPLGPAPGAFYIKGHVQFKVNLGTGQLTLISYTGTATSICDMLA